MFGYGWILMIILTIMILAGFAAITFALARGRRDTPMTNGSHPLRLLDERLARGEVDIDEYQRRRDRDPQLPWLRAATQGNALLGNPCRGPWAVEARPVRPSGSSAGATPSVTTRMQNWSGGFSFRLWTTFLPKSSGIRGRSRVKSV